MAKSNTQLAQLAHEAPAEAAAVTLHIGDMSLTVPRKYTAGHVLTEREALALDSFIRSRFAANMRSDIERGGKTYTAEELAEKYAAYELGAVRSSEPGATLRAAAARRVLVEMFDEHNASVDAVGSGPFGSVRRKLPAGKGSKEAIEALCAKVLANPAHADRVAKHVAAIKAERGTARSADDSVVAADADLDI